MYEYATGLVRVLEKEILDQSDIARMIEAPNSEAAFSVLNDTDIKDNLSGLNPERFEEAIQRDNVQLKKLIKRSASEDLCRFIFLQEDYFNLKLVLKEKFLGIKINPEEYSDLGTIKIEKLKKIADGKIKYGQDSANGFFSKNIKIIKKILRKKEMKNFIDAVTDAAYFQNALYLAKKIGSETILDFLRLSIDTTNIKNFLRAKKLGIEIKKIQKHLIAGGIIKTPRLKKLFSEGEEILLSFLKNRFAFSGEWGNLIETYENNRDIIELEKNLDLLPIIFLNSEARKIGSGAEIIFNYAYIKKIMNQNIRLILIGKINNIPIEEIKMRLRIEP